MPLPSSSSASTRFLDRDEVVHSLRELSTKLVRCNRDVQAVILFGSLARDDFGRRSDADLLICLRSSSSERPSDRIPEFLAFFLDAPLPVDVFPFTERELLGRIESGSSFWNRAFAEGMLLAGKLPDALRHENVLSHGNQS